MEQILPCVMETSANPFVLGSSGQCHTEPQSPQLCQVWVYSSRGSGQVWTKTDKGGGQRAGQEVSPARVGDRLDSMTKDNEC